MKSRLLSVILSLTLCSGLAYAQTSQEAAALRSEVEADLVENILPFWIDNSIDPDGGFYGTVGTDGKAFDSSDKGSILNARIIWTFSRAYREYGLPEYKEVADRAADYFIGHFIDNKFGGVFWALSSEGVPKETIKQSYATAFGIYGLSEHFRATGRVESLKAAIGLYETLENNAHDKDKGGYIESFGRDYSRIDAKGVDGMANATKTMNTHIHIMEAYSTLYTVWPNENLKANISELISILGDKLYSPETGHLILYCDDDWNVLEPVDSYGHDIETSWLLSEAAGVIGDEVLIARTNAQAVKMVDTALAEGLNEDGSMIYEKNSKGYRRNLSWWPQCETVIGCINAWQITGQKKYFDAAAKTWNFIKNHFVDKENGGWFKGLTEDGKPTREPKISMWNCPYHNSRLAFELIHRLAKDAVHTEVMAWSNITGVRMNGELVDFESTLRTGTPGGEIELSGREKQNGIKYDRNGSIQTTVTPMKNGVTLTQTVEDVDASTVRLTWSAEATEDAAGGAYFCISLPQSHYANSSVKLSGKKIIVKAPDRSIVLAFDKKIKTFVREEDGQKVVYATLLPSLRKGVTAQYSADMTVDCVRSHETIDITLDAANPGREFAGFGGNFRIQNVRKDPEVIDYCLDNMRVAFGRVEFPWPQWDSEGKEAEHVVRSAQMAQRLKAAGMPVIVSGWFVPNWAATMTTRSDGTSRAFSLKPEMKDRIFESIFSYLKFLKDDYGVEADYFSFNESDLGINVVHTPQEHCDFIKEFGKYLSDRGFKTLMLLGDNSDANTFDFILPALNDPEARRYTGAVSFHSWRGCDDETLAKWTGASRRLNLPLIIAEGSTDAAAHQYSQIFNESTFALYEINLYTRLCAQCQPLSILQWQLTSDYSILWGDGIYGSQGPLRPTQRFFNLQQLARTPSNAFSIPALTSGENVNVAAFTKKSTGESAVHIVNNGASRKAKITGFPETDGTAIVYVTNSEQNSEAMCLPVENGSLTIDMPGESFITVITCRQ